jgi:hypothetical protein
MSSPRTLVNVISLSRIPIALLFVVFFREDRTLFSIALVLCAAALVTGGGGVQSASS